MDKVLENGILSNEEFASYKQRIIRSRFFQQIFLGIGGATVFAVGSALAGKLITMASVATGSTAVFATIGIGALAIGGIACLYIGAKYLSQTSLLDQDFQAKKIGLAARGVEPGMAVPGMGTSRSTNEDKAAGTPAEDDALNASPATLEKTPATHIADAQLKDRVAANEATMTTDKART